MTLSRFMRERFERLQREADMWFLRRDACDARIRRELAASPGLRLPDFIGIGAPQSGTTWLMANLALHPGLFVSRRKELHFFDRHLRRGLSWYADRFRKAGDRVCGEFTPAYMLLRPPRIRLVREILPEARLILILRHPVERAWSAGRRSVSKFARASGGLPIEELPVPELMDYFMRRRNYVDGFAKRYGDYEPGLRYGDYTRVIDNWTRVYDRERLLILFFDDLRARPAQTLRAVCRHLGVEESPDGAGFGTEPINVNPARKMPREIREFLFDRYGGEILRLREMFGDEMPDWPATPDE